MNRQELSQRTQSLEVLRAKIDQRTNEFFFPQIYNSLVQALADRGFTMSIEYLFIIRVEHHIHALNDYNMMCTYFIKIIDQRS